MPKICIIASTAGLCSLVRHLEERGLNAPIELTKVDTPPALFLKTEPDTSFVTSKYSAQDKAVCNVCHRTVPVSISGALAVHACRGNTPMAGSSYNRKSGSTRTTKSGRFRG
jgi:hypothetical protein